VSANNTKFYVFSNLVGECLTTRLAGVLSNITDRGNFVLGLTTMAAGFPTTAIDLSDNRGDTAETWWMLPW
jgi:hypothetical protein